MLFYFALSDTWILPELAHGRKYLGNDGMLTLAACTISSALKIVFRGHVSEARARKSKTTMPAAAVAAPARM